MKKIIDIVFGKPLKNKLFKIFYWFSVSLYITGCLLLIISMFIFGAVNKVIIALPGIVLYPILFRITYNINTYIYKSSFKNNENDKKSI